METPPTTASSSITRINPTISVGYRVCSWRRASKQRKTFKDFSSLFGDPRECLWEELLSALDQRVTGRPLTLTFSDHLKNVCIPAHWPWSWFFSFHMFYFETFQTYRKVEQIVKGTALYPSPINSQHSVSLFSWTVVWVEVCEENPASQKYIVGKGKIFCLFVCFCFLGPHLEHTEVPRLGVWLEIQLLAYTTATAMWDLSRVCDLHHNAVAESPTHWASPGIEPTTSWFLAVFVNHWGTMGTPRKSFF